ncbi:hypothetical protein TorRG33x02_226320 [Trema orientale]|uniref:Uncharacterized protein n=1 Tax=Trema orientale TaxID=63057 RepID=A0A2P5E7S6_TREOI|nr:hypothetical protein TorRG33x02_226320 [Trema orientale]
MFQPCRRKKEVGLGNGDATRAKSLLEDGKGKRKRIRALQSVGKEAGISILGSRAGSKRDKGLQNLINYSCPNNLRKGRKEREWIRVSTCLFKRCEEIRNFLISFELHYFFDGLLEHLH